MRNDMMTPEQFASLLKVYCYTMQASVVFWGLTSKRNRELGNDPTSLHLLWLAADVQYDVEHELEYRQLMAARLGLRIREESPTDHVEPLY